MDGCAFAIERMVVPPEAERDLPVRGDAAVEALAAHPDRQDVRLLVAVLRDGASVCLLRQRDHDSDDAVATGNGHRARPGARLCRRPSRTERAGSHPVR